MYWPQRQRMQQSHHLPGACLQLCSILPKLPFLDVLQGQPQTEHMIIIQDDYYPSCWQLRSGLPDPGKDPVNEPDSAGDKPTPNHLANLSPEALSNFKPALSRGYATSFRADRQSIYWIAGLLKNNNSSWISEDSFSPSYLSPKWPLSDSSFYTTLTEFLGQLHKTHGEKLHRKAKSNKIVPLIQYRGGKKEYCKS